MQGAAARTTTHGVIAMTVPTAGAAAPDGRARLHPERRARVRRRCALALAIALATGVAAAISATVAVVIGTALAVLGVWVQVDETFRTVR